MKGKAGSKNHRGGNRSKDSLTRLPETNVNKAIVEACQRDFQQDEQSTNCRMLTLLIAEAIKTWVRVDRAYREISNQSPQQKKKRKKLLEAIALVHKTAAEFHPLILGDGRFTVNGNLHFAEFVRGLWPEEGGRHRELPAACCAEDLARYFRQERGNPEWPAVGRIIVKRFPGLQPPRKRNKKGQSLARYTRNLVNRNQRWWRGFRQRTWIEPPELYWEKRKSLTPAQQEEERKRFKVYEHMLLTRAWRRIELKSKRKNTKSKRDERGRWLHRRGHNFSGGFQA
jgi:hypothetical protein